MRPKSIRNFDYLYLGAIALNVISFLLGYGAIVAEVERQTAEAGVQMGAGIATASFAFGVLISLTLWFLISRLRIEVVKWVLVVFFIFGLIGVPAMLANAISLTGILNIVCFVMQAAAIFMLFQPDAKEWFAGKQGGDDI